MVVETRSQRQAYLQRPSYPHIATSQSSPSSSVFQSSSSLDSLYSINAPGAANAYAGPSQASPTPLPSPSAGAQPMQYFGSIGAQTHSQQPQGQQYQMQAQTAQYYQQAPHYQQQQQQHAFSQQSGSHNGAYVGQRGNGGGAPATAPFLQDFNLVAEAAKRAQMACLARDLGECGL
ncbi:hypothetical protein LTR86_005980 [Recurvomyces mirabilis]|nr:hypothetical protein LTR86_005980 [Recurvomyces mirabilis]